jgi:RimJ/RimL family protein N-acetyltransferase
MFLELRGLYIHRMISRAALANQAVIETLDLRLVQNDETFLEAAMNALEVAAFSRLTGTHARFTRADVRGFLERLPGRDDRADWAILRKSDGAYLGEVVLNELDEDNRSMNFRIALSSPEVLGRGYGTQATRAVVNYGLDVVGLHRISLVVFAFNPRAQRVYEKCGFVREGVERDALLWDGQWVDSIRMAILASDPRANPAP